MGPSSCSGMAETCRHFLSSQRTMAQKQAQPSTFPPPGPQSRWLPRAERMESLNPAPFRPARWSAGPTRGAAQSQPLPQPAEIPALQPGWHALPSLPGPALGYQPGESPRDEDATAQWEALSALAAASAQRPGAGPSLTPCRLPSRTRICE